METLAGMMNVTKDQMIERMASLNFLKVPASTRDTAKRRRFWLPTVRACLPERL
jgi:5,10-methylenetetrahydrofolate reductase